VLALALGGGLGAATLAPIERGVMIAGTLIVETKVRAIQHQRGGLIGRIDVKEGDVVAEGAIVARLDTSALDEQRAALRAQQLASQRQLALIRQEAATISDLADRKLAARSRVLGLERQVAEVEKEAAALVARIATVEQEIARAAITSPVSGRVLAIGATGRSAVLQPGQTLMEIVPEDDRIVVEGRISPGQIEDIRPGMAAKVWLAGTSWRDNRPITGRLAWLSPDSVEDKRTGVHHFVARVELDRSRRDLAREVRLHPGIRTEILLLTGQRRLIDQLLDPLLRSINRAFRA
jgi:multidrug efflux pump subunit AcrA (membrane-fusion protein)